MSNKYYNSTLNNNNPAFIKEDFSVEEDSIRVGSSRKSKRSADFNKRKMNHQKPKSEELTQPHQQEAPKVAHASIMDQVYDNGMKIRDIIDIIQPIREKREQGIFQEIEVPELGWNGCQYYKILQEEKLIQQPNKSLPMNIFVQ